tara:strand:- start:507 stop:836 length:330 start_codon:yes stop_codon:yes gene_type:complete
LSKDEKDTILTISETKELLEDIDPDELDQIQRRTLDYATKFSKITGKQSRITVDRLMSECNLTEQEATEVVNIMPTSLKEIRMFSSGWKKLISEDNSKKILDIIVESSV